MFPDTNSRHERVKHSVTYPQDIAIIGMACRFPGANSIRQFWKNIQEGVHSITAFSREELLASGIAPRTLDAPGYIPAGGTIEGAEFFDAEFFKYSPREAESLDPQQRLFLELAWHGLEDAGYAAGTSTDTVGVFGGSGRIGYPYANVNEKDHLATRVAYDLGLTGPALTIQTTCSTSLVAIALAVQSLTARECDLAIAGGASIFLPQKSGYIHRQEGMTSPDGRCRPFDRNARGTIFTSGAAVVVLKKLDRAIEAGDNIYATIKGIAINNDGRAKVGYTAPSVAGQARVVSRALELAGIAAHEVGLVEAHGTGTELGDPIEVQALTEAYREHTTSKQYCALNSVKANVGHLVCAAGVAGLIKAALAVRNGILPPQINFTEPNPHIPFSETPFYVNTKISDWPQRFRRRVAGVSSFGIGGTNAHAVLEQPPERPVSVSRRQFYILPLTAKTESALSRWQESLRQYLVENPSAPIADAAYSLQVGRKHFGLRRGIVVRGGQDSIEALADETQTVAAGKPRVAFLFPGQGSQYAGAGATLYNSEPIFRNQFDRCSDLFLVSLGLDLRQFLARDRTPAGTATISRTEIAQPFIFSVAYSLASLWMEWGLVPDAMLGHSIGEYVAATLSGVFTLEDAVKVVSARCRLMQHSPEGAMVALPISEQECLRLLKSSPEVSLASVNGDQSCVISGPREAVGLLLARLQADGVEGQPLATSHAFHSSMMESVAEALGETISRCQLSTPRIPFVSNVHGVWISPEEAVSGDYWARHVLECVRFKAGLECLARDGISLLLEMGPGRTLTNLANHSLGHFAGITAVASMPHSRNLETEEQSLAEAVATVWALGAPLSWDKYARQDDARRISLPGYPFERKRYSLPAQVDKPLPVPQKAAERSSLVDSFYIPGWRSTGLFYSQLPVDPPHDRQTWLFLGDPTEFSRNLAEKARLLGIDVRSSPSHPEGGTAGDFSVDQSNGHSAKRLVTEMLTERRVPTHIIQSSGAGTDGTGGGLRSFFGLLDLVQSFAAIGKSPAFRLTLISHGMHNVMGRERVSPDMALLLGPTTVLPQEYPGLSARSIDISDEDTASSEATLQHVLGEILTWPEETVSAYRNGSRWVRQISPVKLSSVPGTSRIRHRGTYVVTGGLGGIGRTLVEYLARSYSAHVAILTRRPFPPRFLWDDYLRSKDRDPSLIDVITKYLELESRGASIEVASVDVTDEHQVDRFFTQLRASRRRIDGIFHTAGIAGGGIAELKTRDSVSNVLAPKVIGTQALIKASLPDDLDFLVLFSSVEGLRGTSGQVDYSSANAYLDALATSDLSRPLVSINWAAWKDAGMAAETPVPATMRRRREALLETALSHAEGMEALELILASPYRQVVVAPTGITLPKASTPRPEAMKPSAAQHATPAKRVGHPRPRLDVPLVPLEGEAEDKVGSFMRELLGYREIGAEDNFFSLGGHSLMAVQLTFLIRSHFNMSFTLKDLFDAPTARGICNRVLEKLVADVDPEELSALISDVDSQAG